MTLKNSKTAKFISGVSGVAIAFSLALGAAVAPASAATIDDLMAQITALTSQLNALKGTTGSMSMSGSFTKDLQMGSTDDQVMMLQQVLNKSADTRVANMSAGSSGMETRYFGAMTKAAVIKFQRKNSISPAVGYVGPKTRATLNAMGGTVTTGTGTGTGTVTTGSGLTVTSAVQPTASLAPTGASRVPFTKVTLIASNDGDVTVNGVTVERAGFAQNAVFAGVVLLDENGLQVGVQKTLNSNNQTTVGEPFVLKAGTSKTFTIAGNMAANLANFAGQVAALNVIGVNSSATVNGSFPITGAAQTINATLTLGSAQMAVSSFDPNSSQTKEVGTTNFKFAGVRVTAGSSEKVKLWSIRWNQTGSASSNDLSNVQVFVDGTSYPTTVSTDGKYYTALFGTGISIDKGFSKDMYVQGDVVGTGAAGRTVKFDLNRTTDIYLSGETYGYGVTPTASNTASASNSSSEFTTGTPFFDGSLITVSAGSITTISKSNTVAAQNIAVNVPNQVLGGFDVDIKGEPVTVQQIIMTVATSTAAGPGLLTNVSIYDQNGAVVAGPVDATDPTVTDGIQTLTFTDSITFPIGKKTYTIKGKLPSTMANNGTIVLTTVPSSGWTNVTGQTTGNTISLSSVGSFSMNAMTVKGATLSIAVGASPAATTIVAGAQNVTFATYSLNATQSGEDVRFSTIPLRLTIGAAGTANNLSSCQLFDGATSLNTGSNVVNPASSVTTGSDVTFTLDQSLMITKGTSKTITLMCNLSSNASAAQVYNWGIGAAPSIAVTGVISSNDVTETVTASVGSVQTVGSSGTMAVSGVNTNTYKVAAANTTGVELARLTLRPSNEGVNLNKIGMTLTSGSAADFVSGLVSVFDGSTLLGAIDFTGATTATTSNLANITIAKDADKVITFKADLTRIGVGEVGTPGRLIRLDYNSAQGKGLASGTNVEGSGSTSFVGTRVQRTFPVITVTAVGSSITDNYTGNLIKVTIAANSTQDVVMNKLTFGVASSTAIVDRFEMQGPNGIVSSTTPLIMVSSSTARVYFDSTTNVDDRVIQAGTSKDYFIKGINVNLTGGTDTNKGSLSFTLKGDTAYATLPGTYLMSSTTPSGMTGQFTIWSPVSTSSPSVVRDIAVGPNLDDWTNGYGLQITCSGSVMSLGQDCSPVSIGSN